MCQWGREVSSNPKNIIQVIITNDKLSEEEKSELIVEFINILNEEYLELKYNDIKKWCERSWA